MKIGIFDCVEFLNGGCSFQKPGVVVNYLSRELRCMIEILL